MRVPWGLGWGLPRPSLCPGGPRVAPWAWCRPQLFPCSCLLHAYLPLDGFPSAAGLEALCRHDNSLPRPCPREQLSPSHPPLAACLGSDVRVRAHGGWAPEDLGLGSGSCLSGRPQVQGRGAGVHTCRSAREAAAPAERGLVCGQGAHQPPARGRGSVSPSAAPALALAMISRPWVGGGPQGRSGKHRDCGPLVMLSSPRWTSSFK